MEIIQIQVFVSGWLEEVIETSPACAALSMEEATWWHSFNMETGVVEDRVRFGGPVKIASAWPRQ
jgi:hypothetical protein